MTCISPSGAQVDLTLTASNDYNRTVRVSPSVIKPVENPWRRRCTYISTPFLFLETTTIKHTEAVHINIVTLEVKTNILRVMMLSESPDSFIVY